MDIDVAVELIPLSKDKVRMTLITTVNPGVKNVPLSILGWISKKVKNYYRQRDLFSIGWATYVRKIG